MTSNLNGRFSGRMDKLERFQEAAPHRGLGPASLKLVELVIAEAYNPGAPQAWPAPPDLEKLQAEAEAADPGFWRAVSKVYGDQTNGGFDNDAN